MLNESTLSPMLEGVTVKTDEQRIEEVSIHLLTVMRIIWINDLWEAFVAGRPHTQDLGI